MAKWALVRMGWYLPTWFNVRLSPSLTVQRNIASLSLWPGLICENCAVPPYVVKINKNTSTSETNWKRFEINCKSITYISKWLSVLFVQRRKQQNMLPLIEMPPWFKMSLFTIYKEWQETHTCHVPLRSNWYHGQSGHSSDLKTSQAGVDPGLNYLLTLTDMTN